MTVDSANQDLSRKEGKIETTKGDYRHMQTLLIGLIGLLFSLSQVCALIPDIVRNAEELQLFSKSASDWTQLIANLTFVLSCLGSSSLLALFLFGVWITGTVHVGTKKVLLEAEKRNWFVRFYHFVMDKVLPVSLKNWIESLLASLSR